MSFLDHKRFLDDLLGDMGMLTTALRVGSVDLDQDRRFELGRAAAELAGAALSDLDWPTQNDQSVTP